VTGEKLIKGRKRSAPCLLPSEMRESGVLAVLLVAFTRVCRWWKRSSFAIFSFRLLHFHTNSRYASPACKPPRIAQVQIGDVGNLVSSLVPLTSPHRKLIGSLGQLSEYTDEQCSEIHFISSYPTSSRDPFIIR